MEDKMKKLIRKRGTVKGKLTNFIHFLEKFSDKESVQETLYMELKSRMSRLDKLLDEFDDVNGEIEVECDTEDLCTEALLERTNFESEFYKSLSEAELLLAEFGKKFETNERIESDSNGSVSVKGSVRGSAIVAPTRPQLPAIPIPTFSGKVDEWLEFKDMFDSLVNSNTSLSNVEKFHFLKRALQGDALKLVQSRKITSENYEIIWKLLCERYDDKPLLVEHHLDNLLGIPKVQKESASDLQNMVDIITEVLYHLEKLDINTDSWDPLVIHIMVKKLDQNTFLKWEEHRPKGILATLEEFKTFIKERVDSLKSIERKRKTESKFENKKDFKGRFQKSLVSTEVSSESKSECKPLCGNCKDNHHIYNCSKFLKLKTRGRYELAKKLGFCLNCLKKSKHFSKACGAPRCAKCGKSHHILLHYESSSQDDCEVLEGQMEVSHSSGDGGVAGGSGTSFQVKSLFLDTGEMVEGEVLLSTALVQVGDCHGNWHLCRALLDSGSQPNLVTVDLANKLGLVKQPVEVSIVGVGSCPSRVGEGCVIRMQSNYKKYEENVACLVVPSISGVTPSKKANISNLKIPVNLQLADPSFNIPSRVDLLLGANLFYGLLCMGQIRLGDGCPTLQKTKLGWLVTGSLVNTGQNPLKSFHVTWGDVQDQLKRFWEVEELPSDGQQRSGEEEICERLFEETTVKGSDGRFIVRIPLVDSEAKLGESRSVAVRRFHALERRLGKDFRMKKLYIDFMQEYVQMGHMSLAGSGESKVSYYMPHHGVINENSETTKLRVVFDGSAKTQSGLSFNDIQCNGPKLQEDLFYVLLRFRQHQVVVCGDIAKMYRMVWVAQTQRHLQKIIWRFSPQEELSEWTLNTVTYGTKSAPYLAIRCLRQLGLDNKEEFPEASTIILRDFYVDDLLTGADSPEAAVKLCQTVSKILESGGMQLRKWLSNDESVQAKLSGDNISSGQMEVGDKHSHKTLGLWWHVTEDCLKFSVRFSDDRKRISKRFILSEVSKIFDPLGLVGPSVLLAKLLIQKLWLEKVSWDESLPAHLTTEWLRIRSEMVYLNELSIPRKVINVSGAKVEIHGFSDASMHAYGACVYVRGMADGGGFNVHLLCSKVKVSPLKKLSIPRLELCGALLLAQLVDKVKHALTVNISQTYFWCDSKVVLGWISTPSHQLQLFVGNRIGKIQSLSYSGDWRYLKSEDNPADILSRGMYARQLNLSEKWWTGPSWLKLESVEWPISHNVEVENLPELKVHMVTVPSETYFGFHRFSNLNRLQRAICHILRFVDKWKRRDTPHESVISVWELERARLILIRIAQRECFLEEISSLMKNKAVRDKQLQVLNPFVDDEGYLRVGGRLELSQVGFSQKHPLLLRSKHRFTYLLVEEAHAKLLHAGPQAVLCSLRTNYWIIGGRNLARKVVRQCVRCVRTKPVPMEQIMGFLPKERVVPAPPFHITGVDYAGPLHIKDRYGRGSKMSKCYIALFVCMSTKAYHLDAVTDLSTQAFLSCFRRFSSRRGKPLRIFSDNGSNFVGANAELQELAGFLVSHSTKISSSIINEGVEWIFVPPNSPNFGGLWEAGVKMCKGHLKRILGNSVVTYEDLCTVLAQIEAVLNSRPLVPLSPNPTDLEALTPSHFLIGRQLTSLPDVDVRDIPRNKLSRYQHLQMLVQHFWHRWTLEYLGELQKRSKWTKQTKNLEIGQLVVIKDNNLPPLKWKLGRVVQVYPGPDKLVRVASVQTNEGQYKRSISKLCPLPVEPTDQTQD